METILLLEQPDGRSVHPFPVRRRDRLRARLCASQLDRALAEGTSPDSSVALSLHARTLIGPNVRRELARELRGLVREAGRPPSRLDARVPICRQGVLQAAAVLEELADRVAGAEPVEARGVAQARVLLRGADSPLFERNGALEFGRALERILSALEQFVAV
jgi:hypothetical protein